MSLYTILTAPGSGLSHPITTPSRKTKTQLPANGDHPLNYSEQQPQWRLQGTLHVGLLHTVKTHYFKQFYSEIENGVVVHENQRLSSARFGIRLRHGIFPLWRTSGPGLRTLWRKHHWVARGLLRYHWHPCPPLLNDYADTTVLLVHLTPPHLTSYVSPMASPNHPISPPHPLWLLR